MLEEHLNLKKKKQSYKAAKRGILTHSSATNLILQPPGLGQLCCIQAQGDISVSCSEKALTQSLLILILVVIYCCRYKDNIFQLCLSMCVDPHPHVNYPWPSVCLSIHGESERMANDRAVIPSVHLLSLLSHHFLHGHH